MKRTGRGGAPDTMPAPRVGVFGPLLGSTPGRVISQGEVLAGMLRASGWTAPAASTRPSRVARVLDTAYAVARWGRSLDAAVVEVYSGPAFAIAELTSVVLARFGISTVLVLHGGNLPSFSARRPYRVARLLTRAARVVSPSSYLARELSRFAPVEVIPNALPMSEYLPAVRTPARPRLLWMRAFHPVYRPELALEVLSRLRSTHPDARLTLAGSDRGLMEVSRCRAVDLGVADAVDFPGFLDAGAKRTAFAEHDIFLSTNAVDNAPVGLLEAAASGLAIVAMRVGGIADLLDDGATGLLVGDGDVDAMARAVARIIDDEHLAARLSAGAIELGTRSTQSHVREKWVALLQDVVLARPIVRQTDGARAPSVRAARTSDVSDIARVHLKAFPDSAMSALGAGAVERYYRWLLLGPHDAYCRVAESASGSIAGFVFAGRFRGALTGYVRKHAAYLALQVVTRPRLWLVPEVRERIRVAMRLLPRRRRMTNPGQQTAPRARRSFGVLAIAVDPAAQGQGVGAVLMDGARREATRRGADRMHLTVHPSNTGAIAFYERLGWKHDPGSAGSMWIDVEERNDQQPASAVEL